MQQMLDEALRCLRRHTGLTNWENALAYRVDSGLRSETCGECGGYGYVSTRYALGPTVEHDCDKCQRQGYVLVSR